MVLKFEKQIWKKKLSNHFLKDENAFKILGHLPQLGNTFEFVSNKDKLLMDGRDLNPVKSYTC